MFGENQKQLALDPLKTSEETAQKVSDIWFSLPKSYAQDFALSVPRRLRNFLPDVAIYLKHKHLLRELSISFSFC